MLTLKIAEAGDPVLRQKARSLGVEEIKSTAIQKLIALMKATMEEAPGVGVAAPQVGEPLQLIVIEDKIDYMRGLTPAQLQARQRVPVPFQVVINPSLEVIDATSVEFYEGCLSVNHFGVVPRAKAVKVTCLNECAESVVIYAQDWYARILQHEIDHLQGTLNIDRMQLHTFTTLENFNKYWKKL